MSRSIPVPLPVQTGTKRRVRVCWLVFATVLSTVRAFVPVPTGRTEKLFRQQQQQGPRFLPNIHDLKKSAISADSMKCWASVSSDKDVDPADRRAGLWVLLTVPFAWGTFEPAVRYVYNIQPDVPPFVFQFVYYLIAASSLAMVSSLSVWTSLGSTQPTATSEAEAKETRSFSNDITPTGVSPNNSLLSLQGGLELGTYLFLGNGMQVIGLKTIPSDRAAFLLQLTTIFVPLVQTLLARNLSILPARTWLACFMALAGVALIGLDDAGGGTAAENDLFLGLDAISFSTGDIYIILAALFYTFHCLRLDAYAKQTNAIQLALAKASTEMSLCGVVILASLLAANVVPHTPGDSSLWNLAEASGKNILAYKDALWNDFEDPNILTDQWGLLAAATAWIGLVTVAYTIAAQSYGQARVPPATANLIYTIQPLFTAIIAFLVLAETIGPAGYAGGLLIGSAVVLEAKNDASTETMQ